MTTTTLAPMTGAPNLLPLILWLALALVGLLALLGVGVTLMLVFDRLRLARMERRRQRRQRAQSSVSGWPDAV